MMVMVMVVMVGVIASAPSTALIAHKMLLRSRREALRMLLLIL